MADTVYASGAPPLPFGSFDFPTPGTFPLYTGSDPLNLGAYEGQAYLLAAAPFDPSIAVSIVAPPLPFGEVGYPLPLAFGFQGAAPTIYPAATVGRTTKATDTPPSTAVPAKLSALFNYQIELFQGADPTTTGTTTYGTIDIADTDGELDGLITLGWDGAPLTLSRGDPAADFSSWSVVASVAAAGILYDPRQKQIQLRDLSWLLKAAPLHGIRYGGGGGVDGDASLVGRLKPYAVGHFFNAAPVLIAAALLCYQVSCSSVVSLIVKDGGEPLIDDGDTATYAALAAAIIPAGHYRTCLALGLFRLGGNALLACTVDGLGDNDPINGQSFPSTRAQICRRIATGRGLVRLDDSTQIDAQSFLALDNKQGAACGWYWDGSTDVTKADALTTMLQGNLGFWLMRFSGQLAVGQIEDPAGQAPYVTFTFPSPDTGEVRVAEPSMTAYLPPTQSTFIGWSKNFTPMQTNQIAGALDLTTSAILQTVTRYAQTLDQWVANAYPTAPVEQLDGAFAFQADAQAESDRQQPIRRVRRERYQLDVTVDPLGDWTGRIIALVNYPRFGVGSMKNFLCVGASVNNGAAVTLELYG